MTQEEVAVVKPIVAKLLPTGWQAGECFMLALSGSSSPVMVDARRVGYQERLRTIPVEQRREWKRQWSLETVEQAKKIEQVLQQNGLVVVRDCGSIYIKGRRNNDK